MRREGLGQYEAAETDPFRVPYHPGMTQTVRVWMLPELLAPEQLAGGVAVVIDVLRASTTIIHALANGAKGVVPCGTVEEARAVAAGFGAGEALLGGERGGTRIEGFDLDNSPLRYTRDTVAGKTIVFTTTNGTRALRACAGAERVLIGAFVNRVALTRVLREDGRPVHLVCAGTRGQLTAEDILFAGAAACDAAWTSRATPARAAEGLLHGRTEKTAPPASVDVQTQMAVDYYLARSRDRETFLETIRESRGGKDLRALGMDADIERAAQEDLFEIVPEWLRLENSIR
jgi:2-phosphosulfolactate phosphatase